MISARVMAISTTWKKQSHGNGRVYLYHKRKIETVAGRMRKMLTNDNDFITLKVALVM